MHDYRRLNLETLEWEKLETSIEDGIFNIAWHQPYPDSGYGEFWEYAGYNDMLRGDKVIYDGKQYTIVMVSGMVDFGLSETGKLPYSIRVHPIYCKKVETE